MEAKKVNNKNHVNPSIDPLSGPWTLFWDMHSGGGTKESPFEKIYIQASEEEAKVIFYNRFGHNPERVTCTCCGGDYSISEGENFAQCSGYHRGCDFGYINKNGGEVPQNDAWISGRGLQNGCKECCFERPAKKYGYNTYQSVEEYVKNKDVLVIRAEDIKPEERIGEVPRQGYVWVD